MLKPINLALGWPSPYLVPREALRTGAQAVFSSVKLTEDASIYGPDPGQPEVREHVAKWLSKIYAPSAGPIPTDHIILSNGASGNLGCILIKFSDPTYTLRIWMGEPTYFLACPIFEDAGFVGRLKGVPEDEEGIDVDFLKRNLQEVEQQEKQNSNGGLPKAFMPGDAYPKPYRHIIYAVPSFANPSAKTMSVRRRHDLVKLAREFDALVITDDVYDLLRWSGDLQRPDAPLGAMPPRLVDIDRAIPGQTEYGNTVSNGSFSKLIAPGMRASWAEGTAPFIHALSTVGHIRSSGAPSQMNSIIIDHLLTTGALDKHINEVLIPTYAERSRAMMEAINKHLVPVGVTVSSGRPFRDESSSDNAPLAGGFFIYLTLPSHLPPASKMAVLAREKYELKLAYGQRMTIKGDPDSEKRVDPHGIRLSWSWHSAPTIDKGIKRLGALIREIEGQAFNYEEESGNDSGVDAYFQSN